MKIFIIYFFTLVFLNTIYSQIYYIEKNSDKIVVYGYGGRKISSMYLSKEQFIGAGCDFFVIKSYNKLTTFNEKCQKISILYLSPKMEVLYVIGQGIVIKNGSRIEVYDKYCKKLFNVY